jgi:5-formyltetrahydrofolate cyclo-ligase
VPEKGLWFGRYAPDTILQPNRYRIPEPAIAADTVADPSRFDLVLVPLVGFDLVGNRLGMGGSYYDRTFAYRLENKTRHQRLVGLAFECQKCERLPAEPWDVPLDGVVTEAGIYRFTPD